MSNEENVPTDTYLRDFVYGSIDGTITTFAIVAGVVGAGLQSSIILTLGLANLFADGFSMAASNFLGTRAERQARDKNKNNRSPGASAMRIRAELADEGFDEGQLDRIAGVIDDEKSRWFGDHAAQQPVPWRAALMTFIAFVAIGSVPLLSFLVNLFSPGTLSDPFLWSTALTALAFLLIGAIKARVSPHHWSLSAIETLAVGGLAASIAYLVGAFLRGLGG